MLEFLPELEKNVTFCKLSSEICMSHSGSFLNFYWLSEQLNEIED
jgi:hypothetical protein